MEQAIGLNAAQMDFLQLLAHIKTTEELEELSQVVSDYYARKAEEGMNRLKHPHASSPPVVPPRGT